MGDTNTMQVAASTTAGAIHYSLITPEGRPFFSRILCDLAATHRGPSFGSNDWSRINCPKCRELGPDTVATILVLSDATLISLGAWPAQLELAEASR